MRISGNFEQRLSGIYVKKKKTIHLFIHDPIV